MSKRAGFGTNLAIGASLATAGVLGAKALMDNAKTHYNTHLENMMKAQLYDPNITEADRNYINDYFQQKQQKTAFIDAEQAGLIAEAVGHVGSPFMIGAPLAAVNAVSMGSVGALGLGIAAAGVLGSAALGGYIGKKSIEQGNILQKSKYDSREHYFVKEHPYMLSGIGYASGMLTGGLGSVLVSPSEHAAGAILADEIRKNPEKSVGLGASFAYRNPYLGSAIATIPGLGVNKMVAGERIADRAIANKSFAYDHPILAATMGQLIPGAAKTWHHAAGKIMLERQRRGLD